jgi:hypothetical protein
MSVKVMGAVWDLDLPPAQKFVLLAYADHADHEGENVYPAIGLVSRKTGLSERQVQTSTRELEQAGYIVSDGFGPRGTNRWRITLAEGVHRLHPPDMAVDNNGGVHTVHRGGAQAAPEPSFNRIKTTDQKDGRSRQAPPPEYPSSKIFRDTTHRWPAKALQPELHEAIGDTPEALDLWKQVVRAWIGLGWNPMNTDGMLDCFKRKEIPHLERKGDNGRPAVAPDHDYFVPASMRVYPDDHPKPS